MKRAYAFAFAALWIYWVFVALGSLLWPLGRDQGIFAWVGDVILSGGAPYLDAWDVKGIAAQYTYAFSQALFGRSLWGIRLLDLLFLGISAFALWRFLQAHCDRLAVQFGVLVYLYLHLLGGYWSTAQPDGWATMCVVGALALRLVPGAVSPGRSALAGALIGCAALYTFLFGFFLLPLLRYQWFESEGVGEDRLKRLALTLLGAAGVVSFSVAWLAAQGALSDFVEIQFGFNRVVHTQSIDWTWARSAQRIGDYFRWFDWALAFGGFGIFSLWRSQRRMAIVLLFFFATAIGCVVIQNKYYSYHWYPVRLCLVVFFTFGISYFVELFHKLEAETAIRWVTSLRIWLLASMLVIAWVIAPPLNFSGASAIVLGRTPVEDYYKGFKSYWNASFHFLSNYETARHLEEHSREDESVLVWGFEPMINFLSGRRSPTRFGYNYPLVAVAGTEFEKPYRDQFMRQLFADLPRYIVVAVGDQNSLMPKSSRIVLGEFERLSRLLHTRYRIEKRLVGFEIWRRHDPVRKGSGS